MEPRATFPGAPKAILTLRLFIAWIESMVIDWSTWSDTGRVRFGTCLDFAPTASVYRPFMAIDKWARWG